MDDITLEAANDVAFAAPSDIGFVGLMVLSESPQLYPCRYQTPAPIAVLAA